MSREIKFRAWDKAKRKFVDFDDCGGYLFLSHDGLPKYIAQTSDGQIHKPYTGELADLIVIQLFTGLLDKNGKEIYEGDIITFRPEPGSCGIVGAINGENAMTRTVVWLDDDAQWGWELPSGNRNQSGYGFCKRCESVFEVIGNIYENSELKQ